MTRGLFYKWGIIGYQVIYYWCFCKWSCSQTVFQYSCPWIYAVHFSQRSCLLQSVAVGAESQLHAQLWMGNLYQHPKLSGVQGRGSERTERIQELEDWEETQKEGFRSWHYCCTHQVISAVIIYTRRAECIFPFLESRFFFHTLCVLCVLIMVFPFAVPPSSILPPHLSKSKSFLCFRKQTGSRNFKEGGMERI